MERTPQPGPRQRQVMSWSKGRTRHRTNRRQPNCCAPHSSWGAWSWRPERHAPIKEYPRGFAPDRGGCRTLARPRRAHVDAVVDDRALPNTTARPAVEHDLERLPERWNSPPRDFVSTVKDGHASRTRRRRKSSGDERCPANLPLLPTHHQRRFLHPTSGDGDYR